MTYQSDYISHEYLYEKIKNKYEIGKSYKYIGDRMHVMKSVHMCVHIDEKKIVFKHLGGISVLSVYHSDKHFNHDMIHEVEPPSQPRPKNKYRSFTKDDIGKTFTVRQWDDMADEFGEKSEIITVRKEPFIQCFVSGMSTYCGEKLIIEQIMDQYRSITTNGGTWVWAPQMFEECIIKEPKAGDRVTVKSEGLKIMTASALKESIEKDMKALSKSIYYSTPSSNPWYEKFKNSESRVELPTGIGASKEFVESLNQQWGIPYFKIEGHDLSRFDKQDKNKFNTGLIKTEKLNFRMDR